MSLNSAWWWNMNRASWRGVYFECQSLDDDLRRRWVEHEYPYVDGADIEDMGRSPRRTQITAVFMGLDYLDNLSDLLQKVTDGKSGTFQHPLLGSWTARVSVERIGHTDEFRDGCTVDLMVVEDGTGADVEELESTYLLEDELTSTVDDVSDALDDVEDLLEDIEEGVDAVNDAIDEARDFVENATSSVTQAVQRMNNCIKKVDKAVAKAKRLGDLDSYKLVQALNMTSRRTRKLGKRVLGDKWPLRTYTVAATTCSVLLAQHLYTDKSRASEITELNPGLIRNPSLIPVGTVLQIFNK